MVVTGMNNTCDDAAQGGHLEVLKWARENGCDWDIYMCDAAHVWTFRSIKMGSRKWL